MKNFIRFIVCLIIMFYGKQTFSQIPKIKWDHVIGGDLDDDLYDIKQTSDNGFIIVGTSTSSNRNLTFNYGEKDIWVVKTDASGAMQWQKSYGGSDDDIASSISITNDGGYFVTGSSVSLDGDLTGNIRTGMWVFKIDNTGTMLWQRNLSINTNFTDEATSGIQTASGIYVVTGTYNIELDSNGVQFGGSISSAIGNYFGREVIKTSDNRFAIAGDVNDDFYITKRSDNNSDWEVTYGGSRYDYVFGITETSDHGFIVSGITDSNDGDVSGLHSTNVYDFWIVKVDSLGLLKWQKCFGGSDFEDAPDVAATADGGFVIAGRSESNDGDVTGNHGDEDFWVVKCDSIGNIQWQRSLGGTKRDFIRSVIVTNDQSIVVVGRTFGSDGDIPANNLLIQNGRVVCFASDANVITGNAFCDLNTNGVRDISEHAIVNKIITEQNSGTTAFTYTNGAWSMLVDTGNYNVISPVIPYYTAAPLNYNGNFSAFFITDSLKDFAFQPNAAINDLSVSLTAVNPVRAGRDVNYLLNYKNTGTTILNPVITFFPDLLSYHSSSLIPQIITTDSIVFQPGVLNPFESGEIKISLIADTSLVFGTTIKSVSQITPVAGDAEVSNNRDTSSQFVIGSFDPNDKSVNRSSIHPAELTNAPYLDYIIRFQNTGNDTAFVIRVTDTIPLELNMSSFDFISSSHVASIDFDNNNRVMTFLFNNILLPDSNVNENASHGFIRYRIKPKSTLQNGDQIRNKASIYFDFNAPVITNDAITDITISAGIIHKMSPEAD